jgi:transcriptional regulator with XRE-family HTH domain
VKTEERERARELRAAGWSIKEIERSINVARSSVSRWVRDIELTDVHRLALEARSGEGRLRAAAQKAEAARRIRATHQEHGRERARSSDDSYMAGCMLYWAEGEKSRWSVSISNSDVELMRFFAAFLRQHFAVRPESMRVHLHLFPDHAGEQRDIEEHWLRALDLPPTCLRKTILNSYSKYTRKKRTNKLPYGTCKLRVHSTQIVQTIFGSIQEFGGFERPQWLD